MSGTVKKFLIGASVVASMSAIASTPAFAGTLTRASITGSDYNLYKVVGNQTVLDNKASLADVLQGSCPGYSTGVCNPAGSPGGNAELFASSEDSFYRNLTNYKNAGESARVSLNGTIGGKDITLSSLTYSDWFETGQGQTSTVYGANNFATTWFNAFLSNAGYSNFVGNFFGATAFRTFLDIGGFQQSSDPNISYVNQDDATGKITIGLAGHYDLKAYYTSKPQYGFLASFVKDGLQASEVVKYTYNGVTDYLYSFGAAKSGLTEKSDRSSHNGEYEVTIAGVQPTTTKSVPEPSAMLGLMAVGGMLAATKRKLMKKA